MELVISHESALELFERRRFERLGDERIPYLPSRGLGATEIQEALAGSRSPRSEEIARVLRLTGLSLPLHVSVARAAERFTGRGITCHVWRAPVSEGALMRVAPGVLAFTPPWTLAQIAQDADVVTLALEACLVCGTFARRNARDVRPDDDGERSLLCNLPRVCRVEEIVELAERLMAARIRGGRRLAEAAACALDGSNSPAESRVAMLLSASRRRGGFGLRGLRLNEPVELDETGASLLGRRTMRPDILLPSGDACEFDSKTWHATEDAHERDALRREALSASGYVPHTITSGQVRDLRLLSALAAQLAKRQGMRCRPPSERMLEARAMLHRALFPFGSLPLFGGHARW